ncbi:MAG TPA: hypothetical protein PLV55_00290 [Anaerohalosphaeraceae bacterium]|nr:hypothetical protein [Anaerohalosphaeraceae bacterium]HOL87671.1 hypothetical protein [Anaerohalosphaeraceae bacterium]
MPMELPSDFLIPSVSSPSLTAAERLGARQKSAGRTKELEETAKQFEGILLQQVFKQMKEATESLEVNDEEEGEETGFGEQIQSMFWMFLGEQVSREGGVGLWKEMVQQWMKEESFRDAADSAGPAGLDERL